MERKEEVLEYLLRDRDNVNNEFDKHEVLSVFNNSLLMTKNLYTDEICYNIPCDVPIKSKIWVNPITLETSEYRIPRDQRVTPVLPSDEEIEEQFSPEDFGFDEE